MLQRRERLNSKAVRSYLITGLVVWLPVLATFVVIRFLIDLLDQTIALLPAGIQPDKLIGMHLPGLGVLLSLLILLLTGMAVTNLVGQKLMQWSESLLERIPLVRTIYNGTKQLITAVFSTESKSFKKVLLVEWPRKGIWTIAFHTGTAGQKLNKTDQEMISIFLPTTPNPIGGFVMILPKSETIELDMTIDEALKYVISLGVVQPGTNGNSSSLKSNKY